MVGATEVGERAGTLMAAAVTAAARARAEEARAEAARAEAARAEAARAEEARADLAHLAEDGQGHLDAVLAHVRREACSKQDAVSSEQKQQVVGGR